MGKLTAFGVALSVCAGCGGSSDNNGTTTGPSTETLIGDVCSDMRQLPCGTDQIEQQCLASLREDQGFAESEHCTTEFDQYLQCASSKPMSCIVEETNPPTTRAVVNVQCSGLDSAFWKCVTLIGPDCSVGFGPTSTGVSCGITCPDFSSSCQGPSQSGPVDCTCQTGPHAGTTFQASDCDQSLAIATGHTCS